MIRPPGKRDGVLLSLAALAVAVMLGACGGDVTSAGYIKQQGMAAAVFDEDVQTFRVSVYYEEGAVPYDGMLGVSTHQTWDITEASYEELFQGFSGRTVQVPKSVSAMELISDQARTDWDSEALVALGGSVHPSLQPAPGTVDVGLIFLNGTFEGRTAVLGVHISGYPFTFVFKDVVAGVTGPSSQKRYVEQSVAVHEIGHAVGLVNNGVPMSAPHEDQDHPKHTLNEDGVMYWATETKSGAVGFVSKMLKAGDLGLFGPESLMDAQDYRP